MATEQLIAVLDAETGKLDVKLDKSKKKMDQFDSSTKKADKDLSRLGKTATTSGNQIIKAGKAANQTTSAFKLQKNSAQQLGFQLQDVAVQAQAGTNAFTILGQQGSQLASVMGPGGALVGAAIAIGAAIGGVLFKALGGAGDATENLTEKLKELIATTVLTESQVSVLVKAEESDIKTRKEKIAEIDNEIKITESAIALQLAAIEAGTDNEKTINNLTEANKQSNIALTELTAARELETDIIKQSNEDIELYNSLLRDGTNQSLEQKNAIEKLIQAVQTESEVLNLSSRELLERELRLRKATEAQIAETLAIFDATTERRHQLEFDKQISEEKEKADKRAEDLFNKNLEREQLKAQSIIDRLRTETDALAAKLDEEKALLDRTIEDETERKEALINLEQEFQDKLVAIKAKADNKLKRATDKKESTERKARNKVESDKRQEEDSRLNAAFAVNTALLNDNKAIAKGLIVADAATAIIRQFKDFPFPVALGNSIAIGATAITQLTNAEGSSRGGGSISSSVAASASTATEQEEVETSDLELSTRGTTSQDIVIRFATDTGDELLDALAGGLNERERRG